MAFRIYKSIRFNDAIEYIDINITASDVGAGASSASDQVLIRDFIAGTGGVSAGSPVRTTSNAADTVVTAGNSAATAAANIIGIATANATSGTTCTIIAIGNLSTYSNLTIGATQWLGSAGTITETIPTGNGSVIQRMGMTKNSTTLTVRIGEMRFRGF